MLRRLTVLALIGCLAFTLAACGQEDASSRDSKAEESATGDEATDEEVPEEDSGTLEVASSAFDDGGKIPAIFAGNGVEGGENTSIPVRWAGSPAATKSYALAIVDIHPVADDWVHWMVVDIPATASGLGEGVSGSGMPEGARELSNSFGDSGYGGPEPPPGSGDHEYVVTIYALDAERLDVAEDTTLDEFLEAVQAAELSRASVSGFFGR